jgi:hypothetical protein
MSSVAVDIAPVRETARSGRSDGTCVVRAVLAACSVVAIGAVLAVAVARLAYPGELEWLEGAMVDHVARVVHGQTLYPAPSVDFVAFGYGPLFAYVAAAISAVVGIGFVPLRLVSIGATLACFALLYAIVRRRTGSRLGGLVASGVYASTYAATNFAFDVGRVDSLSIALVLAALWATGSGETARAATGGAFAGLAVLAKQTAVLPALALLAVLVVRRRYRAGAWFVVVAAAVVLAVSIPLEVATGGWYRFFVAELYPRHHWVPSEVSGFLVHDLWQVLPVGVVLTVVSTTAELRRRPLIPLAPAMAAMILAAWLSRLHDGGAANVLMPAYAAVALGSGLALGAVDARNAADHRPPVVTVASVALVIQFATLWFDPRPQIPSAAYTRAIDAFVAEVRAIPGDVLVPEHGGYAVIAGKAAGYDGTALRDVMVADPATGRGVVTSIRDAVAAGRYSAIFLDNLDDAALFGPGFRASYTCHQPDPAFANEAGYPPTGLHTRPLIRCDRITSRAAPSG